MQKLIARTQVPCDGQMRPVVVRRSEECETGGLCLERSQKAHLRSQLDTFEEMIADKKKQT
jgi:hypothetical protein